MSNVEFDSYAGGLVQRAKFLDGSYHWYECNREGHWQPISDDEAARKLGELSR